MSDVVVRNTPSLKWPIVAGFGVGATAAAAMTLLVLPAVNRQRIESNQANALNLSLPWSQRIPTPFEWRDLTKETMQQLDLKNLAMHHPDPIVCYLAANECPKELRAEISEYWARERGVMPLPSLPELK